MVGKVPDLCAPGSVFLMLYNECVRCFELHTNDANSTIKTYIEPKFASFINFCAGSQPGISSILVTVTGAQASLALESSWAAMGSSLHMLGAQTTVETKTLIIPVTLPGGIVTTTATTVRKTLIELPANATIPTNQIPASNPGMYLPIYQSITKNHSLSSDISIGPTTPSTWSPTMTVSQPSNTGSSIYVKTNPV